MSKRVAVDKRLKHGDARRGRVSAEFKIWHGIVRRCTDPAHTSFERYGGRGISVCLRWAESFSSFLADMGRRTSESHSLDRFPDNDGNYEPGNCRWATASEQARNRRPRRRKSHCDRGHVFSPENTYVRSNGKRGCKTCRKMNMRTFYQRKKAA